MNYDIADLASTYKHYHVESCKATMFNFFFFDQKKIQNLMRESGEKDLRKKTFNLFLG